MLKLITIALALGLALPALAQDAPAGAPDMTKMGPMAKAVKREAQDKKELDEWFKAWEAAEKKSDIDALAELIDFPVLMMSDSMAGKFAMMPLDRQQWVDMMKPFMTPEMQQSMTAKHKRECLIISDDLASCEGQATVTMGKNKWKIRSQMIMTRTDGKWKAKSLMEAGWGDMQAPPK